MVRRRKVPARRRVMAAAGVTALALTAAACGSTAKPGSTTGSSSGGSIPAHVAAFPGYPAPTAGNGGSNGQIGVTATSIAVGSPIAAGNGVSNAQIGTFLGAQAYYAMVNASGGIYGRKLNITELNTTFDPDVGLGVFTKAIPQDFAMNGTESNVDAVAFSMVQKSGIPWVGSWFDPQFYALPNAVADYPTLPYGEASNATYALYKKANPSISKVAIIWVNTAGIAQGVNADVAGWKSVGVQTVYNVGVSGTIANLTPYVVQARAKGANVVDAFAEDITEAARLADDIQQQGWHPALMTNYAIYDASWRTLAGAGGVGWESETSPFALETLPFLDYKSLDSTTGGQQFLYWTRKTSSGQPLNVFTVQGWIQAAFFVQGLIRAGADLTRAKLLTALKAVRNFDAGGMTPVIADPAAKGTLPPRYCGNVERYSSGGYAQLIPKIGYFTCVPQKLYSYPVGS
jgi:branched-chain amino acid transport system substrate-binding protein